VAHGCICGSEQATRESRNQPFLLPVSPFFTVRHFYNYLMEASLKKQIDSINLIFGTYAGLLSQQSLMTQQDVQMYMTMV